MQRLISWRKHFNWRMMLMRTVVNAIALLITVVIVPKVSFVDRRLGTLTLLAVGLGILNAFVKPIVQFATLRFIFATYGVVVALINAIILWLLALLLPNRLTVDSILWALVAGAVLGLLSAILENLLGITPPIVSEKYPELREMIKERDHHRVESYVAKAEVKELGPGQDAAEDLQPSRAATDAAAVLAVVDAAQEPGTLVEPEADPSPAADDEPTTNEQEA